MKAITRGEKHCIKSAIDLAPTVFRRLVNRRARVIGKGNILTPKKEDSRKRLESKISTHFEKVNLGADFLPARFLREGNTRTDAVCRIVVRDANGVAGYGSGFLAAPDIIMTNNHVLDDEQTAEVSVAEFFYEGDREVVRVALQPSRFFMTSTDLDYSLVACATEPVANIEHVPLLRNPATVSRNESVNIIQHPRGRMKEVALHNNQVIRIKDKVIHYTTDTEPGSSGSAVFNNDWELVALHHAGWSTGGGNATNEGVRLAAIVQDLINRFRSDNESSEGLESLLAGVTDSSPYLGFFDDLGVISDGREIEVPDFTGDGLFADIGFWNIEHFNTQVSDTRIRDVGAVIGRLSMDVLGLTEVQEGALNRLVEHRMDHGDSLGFEVLNVSGSQDLAVVYDKDTTRVRRRDDLNDRYSTELGMKTTSGRTAFPREPFFVECTVQDSGSDPVKFLMIIVHLKAFGDAQSQARRRLAAEQLTNIISDIRDREKIAVVLGGDFNERMNTDVLSSLKDSPDLFSLTLDDADTDAISYVGHSHRSLIDHIVVSNDVGVGGIAGDDAAIVRLDRAVSDFSDSVSDHVPVVMRIILRDEPIVVTPVSSDDTYRIDVPEEAEKVNVSFQ